MHSDPLINTSRAMQGMKYHMDGKKKLNNSLLEPEDYEQKGDILIRYLFQKRKETSHDMCVRNTGASSYPNRTLAKCLQVVAKENKSKFL